MTILPQLERDLYEAAAERLAAAGQGIAGEAAAGHPGPSRRHRWTRRPPRGAAAAFAGAAVAVAVAVVAITLPGHQRSGSQAVAPAGVAPLTGGAPLSLRQLIQRFAVLRRPQTAADRAWAGPQWLGGPAPLQVIPRFTRLAATIYGERIFLTVSKVLDPGFAGQPAGSDLLSAWVVSADGNGTSASADYTARSDYSRFPTAVANGADGTTWVSIVPDGVKGVVWSFPGEGTLNFVDGNVAAVRVSQPATVAPQRVIWYGSHSHILLTATNNRSPMRVLYGNGVAGARFGESMAAVESKLNPLLGRPSSSYNPGGGCGVADTMQWQDLIGFFKHGRFVGYSYGGPPGSTSSPTLATAAGLTVGATMAHAGRLYGRAFRTSEQQGGTWFLNVASGMLDGFTYWKVRPPHGDIGPQSRITSIQAGPAICAALSP